MASHGTANFKLIIKRKRKQHWSLIPYWNLLERLGKLEAMTASHTHSLGNVLVLYKSCHGLTYKSQSSFKKCNFRRNFWRNSTRKSVLFSALCNHMHGYAVNVSKPTQMFYEALVFSTECFSQWVNTIFIVFIYRVSYNNIYIPK